MQPITAAQTVHEATDDLLVQFWVLHKQFCQHFGRHAFGMMRQNEGVIVHDSSPWAICHQLRMSGKRNE